MTPEQKANNKNYILNNLDKYVIDSRQNFYGEDAEIDYSYIDKNALPDGAFEEIRDQIYQKVTQNKNDWEITDYNSESWHVASTPVYRHKTTGMSNHSAGFTWEQKNRLESVLGRRNENDRTNDNPSPSPRDDGDEVANRRRQTAITEIEDQFAISNITIDEIEKLARDHVAIENIGREQGIWPLSGWKSKINGMRETSEISNFHYALQGFIHAVATRRDEGDYERTVDSSSSYDNYFGSNWYEDWRRDNDDYLRRTREDNDNFWRDFDRRNREEGQRQDRVNDDWKANYLREKKELATDRIEEYLVEKNVSATELNKKLGKGDWKQEINKFSDFGSERIMSKQHFLEGEIDKLSRKFTCAGCGRTRDDIYSPHEEDGKNFCINFNCWEKYRKKNGKEDPAYPGYNDNNHKDKEFKDLKDEVKRLKEYLEGKLGRDEKITKNKITGKTTVVKKNPLGELLGWMKKEGIANIRLDPHSNQLVIGFGSNNSKTLENKELSAEQKELRNFFMQNPSKRSFSRSELEKLGNIEGKDPKNKSNKSNDGKVIGGIIVAGIIFMVVVIIGVAVYKSRKKNY